MESLTQVVDQAALIDIFDRADGSEEYKKDLVNDVTGLSSKDSQGNSRQDEGVGDVIQLRNQGKGEIEDQRRGALTPAHLFGPSSSNYTKLSISRALFNTVQVFLTRQGAKGSPNDTKDTGQKVFCQYLGLRGLDCDVGLDMASVQRAMFAANIPTQFEEGIAPNEVVCALGPVGGDIWMKNEGQDLIMFHEGFDNATLSRSQRRNLEKLEIIQHTLIGTKEDALEWMINGAYTRGQLAQQQILNAASPPPAEDHDKHIDEVLALFHDEALDAADPNRMKSIVTAWPLAQEVRQFVEDQMLFLIHLVANNGIETILRRIISDGTSKPNIGILGKQDRKAGVIPLPRSVLQPAVHPGNIIAEDNEAKIVELDEDGNVIDPEIRERELAVLKADAEAHDAAQKEDQKAALRAAQKEKKARLKANRRARLKAKKVLKKTEENGTQQKTTCLDAANHMELANKFRINDKKQQEVLDFELAKKLELAEKSEIYSFGRAQQIGMCEKPKLADESDLGSARATTSSRKDNKSAQAVYIMVSPTQRANKKGKAQRRAQLEKSQEDDNGSELAKHLELCGQQKMAQEVGVTKTVLKLQQQEDMESSPNTKQAARAEWEKIIKDAMAEYSAEAKRKQNPSEDADDASVVKTDVLTKQEEMAKAEEFEKKRAFIQHEARLKKSTAVRAQRSDEKVNAPQPVKKPAPDHMSDEKVNISQPAKRPFQPRNIVKNDENVNTLQNSRNDSVPKTILRPQERKRSAPLSNAFPGLHVENSAGTSDHSIKKRKAAASTKTAKKATGNTTTGKPALNFESTADFPSLDGSTSPNKASAFAVLGSALAWSKPAITGVPPRSMPPAVEKSNAFPALDGSITPIRPPANVVADVGNSSSWSDAVMGVAPETSAPARIERQDEFPDLEGSVATTNSSANNVAAMEGSWSKTAAGEIARSAVKNSVDSTTEYTTLDVGTTPVKDLAKAVARAEGALSWSKIAASPVAPATLHSAREKPRGISPLDGGGAETEFSAKAVARDKLSNLIVFWNSKNSVRLDKMGKSRYNCSACKEKFGNFFDLLGHLKSEQSHRDLEVKLVYDPNGERVVIWVNKPPAANDAKTRKLFSEEVAPRNKSPMVLTKAEKKAAAFEAPNPGLDAGTVATEVPAEMIRCKKNVPLSSFSKLETTRAAPKVTSIVCLPRLKGIGKDNHNTSEASKLTFGSLEAEGQALKTTVFDEAGAKDHSTVANPGPQLFGLNATASPVTFDAGTTVKLPVVPVVESSLLMVTKTRAEAGKMKRRDSVNFIRTRTDSRAAQLGSPLGPAGQAPSTPPTPLALSDAVVSGSGTSASEKGSAPVLEWRKQAPVVVSKQPEVQEQHVDVKGKCLGKPSYQFPAFQFPASLAFFGDISSSEPTCVDRLQKPKATRATPATLKPFSSAAAAIAAVKRPVFQTTSVEDLAEMKVNSICFACGKHGHAQIDCPSFIELATGVAAVSNVVNTRHAVDGSAPKRLIATVTAEELAGMTARGLCFACGHPGHGEGCCPFFKDTLPTALCTAAKSNVERATAIVASSAGRHDFDAFPLPAQTPPAEQLAGMRARSQCLSCEDRGRSEADCPHYGATRVAVTAAVSNSEAPVSAISHKSDIVIHRKVGPPIRVAVRDTTATAAAVMPAVQTSDPVVSHDTALANRVAAPPVKVVGRAPGVGQTLNEFQIEERSAFLERMAALIKQRVPVGQPGGEVVSLRIPQRSGGDETMTMVLPERRVFKHKRSKSAGDKLDVDVSYYTIQEQEHFLRNQFFECKHTPGAQKGDNSYCSVHNGDDPLAYCELDSADDLASGEPLVRRNSISLPHLEGNPCKIPDGSGAFVRTHKRAPAALVSRIENPASLAPVTQNVHVFCAGVGL